MSLVANKNSSLGIAVLAEIKCHLFCKLSMTNSEGTFVNRETISKDASSN